MYTALVLTEPSRRALLNHFQGVIPAAWEVLCHHMTINMGTADSGPLTQTDFELNQKVELTVLSYAYDGLVMAAGVQSDVPSVNQQKHITLAVNRAEGGKPFLSNKLTNWQPTTPLKLQGTIEEVR